jgi:hypothetical protein
LQRDCIESAKHPPKPATSGRRTLDSDFATRSGRRRDAGVYDCWVSASTLRGRSTGSRAPTPPNPRRGSAHLPITHAATHWLVVAQLVARAGRNSPCSPDTRPTRPLSASAQPRCVDSDAAPAPRASTVQPTAARPFSSPIPRRASRSVRSAATHDDFTDPNRLTTTTSPRGSRRAAGQGSRRGPSASGSRRARRWIVARAASSAAGSSSGRCCAIVGAS